MPATCVPQYVPHANAGLSKHGDPVFPHFWSWNQNLARVCARGGGGTHFRTLPPLWPFAVPHKYIHRGAPRERTSPNDIATPCPYTSLNGRAVHTPRQVLPLRLFGGHQSSRESGQAQPVDSSFQATQSLFSQCGDLGLLLLPGP